MKLAIDIEPNAVRKAAESLAQSSTLLDDLSSDPKKVLAKLGVSIDDETAKMIAARVSSRAKLSRMPAAAAATIVHIDT